MEYNAPPEIIKKFAEYVALARGDSYLAYLAIRSVEDSTDEAQVSRYIKEHLK